MSRGRRKTFASSKRTSRSSAESTPKTGGSPERRIAFDTSAYARFVAGQPEALAAVGGASTVFLPVPVLAELHAGFRGGRLGDENRALLRHFLDEPFVRVVDVTVETAERYGKIQVQLRRAGRPIPVNDIWIAACALEVAVPLVTADRHFTMIAGLDCRLLEPGSLP